MNDAQAARGERGWFGFLALLASFLLLPFTPYIRAIAPLEQTILMLVPALAVCALVGWWAGGRLSLAIVWTVLAAWMLSQSSGDSPTHDRLTRGWSLLLAGTFGFFCLVWPNRAFFSRALGAFATAFAIGLLLLTIGRTPPSRLQRAVESRAATLLQDEMASVRQLGASTFWRDFVAKRPEFASYTEDQERIIRAIPDFAAVVYPAMLGIESLAALALAWGLYHRLSRTRIGEPLGALREFRFNDQLVWGLVVGITALLVPSLALLRPLGVNLLLFFGVLYLVRGLAVVAWYLGNKRENEPRVLATLRVVGIALIAFLFWPLAGAIALALGLGDTWVDWRSRAARPT